MIWFNDSRYEKSLVFDVLKLKYRDYIFALKMNSEQLLIDKWRGLNPVQQQEVLDFVDFIFQKSLRENQSQQRAQRVKEWIKWTSDNTSDSTGLPDEALTRDSIYNED